MKYITTIFICVLTLSTLLAQKNQQKGFLHKPLNFNKPLTTIAFGSCNNQEKPQGMWTQVVKNKPDLWIWLGDNIYGDTKDMKLMAKKYQKQKSDASYNYLLANCPVVGTWDDHDFGTNDGCKTYPQKEGSKALMLDFLDVPKDNPVWKREGTYQAYTFGPKGKKVCVILLDARYFRDPLVKAPKGSGQRYHPNTEGTILGETQWKWLENLLKESEADIHLIGSGIQILPTEHAYEKWANFPNERKRLLQLLEKICPANPVLLSGDRHIAEVSKIALDAYPHPIYEVTSSGLTHTWNNRKTEKNNYRVRGIVDERHFAVLHIDWDVQPVQMKVEIRGKANALYETFLLK